MPTAIPSGGEMAEAWMSRSAPHYYSRPRALPDQKFKELEHVLIEKVDQLFRDML